MKRLTATILILTALPAVGAESAGSTATGASGLQVILGFAAVLALMAGAAWALKRFGVTRAINDSPVKIIGGISVGGRERVLVVEAGDQWIVLGVAPGRVNALTTMPRQETHERSRSAPEARYFSAWLKRSIETRNAK